MSAPLYQRIKSAIEARVRSGDWPAGHRLPSENQLVGEYRVSRMTVHRALRELTALGLLVRHPGVGTFVAEPKPRTELLELRNIAEEIAARGHDHACRVVRLNKVIVDAPLAREFDLAAGATLYHSVMIHAQDGVPVQLEDRYVNPAVAPRYLEQDFTEENATAYLVRVAPVESIEHVVEAVLPSPAEADLLDIGADAPCLRLYRRTWAKGQVATRSILIHPGSRYRLGARFVPPSRAAATGWRRTA
jgi:GntR family histidine utilization transcriptional repressor